MRKLESKQKNVKFSYCPYPVTLDKSKDWGPGNIQSFPNGVFFKHNENDIITHGVQPNDDCPIGWFPSDLDGVCFFGDMNGLFDKAPIWIDETVLNNGNYIINTLDGSMDYEVKEPSHFCYNNENGGDTWIQTVEELKKNYYYT